MIAQKSPLLVLSQIINSIFGYVGLFFIIRFIGLQQWGFLSFSLAFIGVLSIFSDLGYGTAHLKFLSSGEYDKALCNGTFLTIRIIQTAATIAIVLGSLYIWLDVFHRGFENNIEIDTIILLIPYFFFNRMKDFSNIYFNSTMRSARMSIPQMVESLVRNSLFILLGIMYAFRIPGYDSIGGAIVLAIIYSISYFLFFLISLLFGRPWHINRPDKTMFMAYTKLAVPLAFVAVIGTISGNIDKVLIEFFWHATATGAFASLQKIVTPILTFSGTISVFFIPLLLETVNQKHFKLSISTFEKMISLFILPFVVVFIALRIYVVNLWSAALIPYSTLLIFITLASYFIAVNTPYSSSLIARGLTTKIGKISIIAILLNIVLDIILIPPDIFGFSYFSLGVLGAAVSTFVAMFFELIAYRIEVLRLEHLKPDMSIFMQAIPVAAQFAFLYGVTAYIKIYSIILFLPVVIISVLIFIAFAIITRQVTTRQIITFAKALNPLSIGKTFRNE
ncbi:MAG: oligosaccharide flippase family protein [Ferroplasma sp.]